jgi:hypothetical protein
MNINLQIFPICHAGAGRHPGNEANRGRIWIPAKRAAQVQDDGVLHRFVTAQRDELLAKTTVLGLSKLSPNLLLIYTHAHEQHKT